MVAPAGVGDSCPPRVPECQMPRSQELVPWAKDKHQATDAISAANAADAANATIRPSYSFTLTGFTTLMTVVGAVAMPIALGLAAPVPTLITMATRWMTS